MTELQTEKRHRDFVCFWVWLIILVVYSSLLLISRFMPPTEYILHFSSKPAYIETWRFAILPAVVTLAVIFTLSAWKWKKWGIFGIYGMGTAAATTLFVVAGKVGNEGFIPSIAGITALAFTVTTVFLARRAWRFFDTTSQHTEAIKVQISLKLHIVLAAWIIFLASFNSLFINSEIRYFVLGTALGGTANMNFEPLLIVLTSLNIVFMIAGLMWKKWAIIGLGAITIMPFVVSLAFHFTSGLSLTGRREFIMPVAIVFAAVLVIIVRPVWNQFKWR